MVSVNCFKTFNRQAVNSVHVSIILVESEGFLRRCVTLRITRFLGVGSF
jgi:hypothetical protein